MASLLKSARVTMGQASKASPKAPKPKGPAPPQVMQTTYSSAPVDIPKSFLSTDEIDRSSITSTKIDFPNSPLPEYAGCYAAVLDNVLSPSECTQLLRYAEASVGGKLSSEVDCWKPALVNAGRGREVLISDYRNSDRIIWDEGDVVQRIWERCLLAEGVKEDLAEIHGNAPLMGWRAVEAGKRWRCERLNERMRFLRYGEGQFFREHCDGAYEDPVTKERSFYTLHLYLNDSIQESQQSKSTDPRSYLESEEIQSRGLCRGGATTFHSHDGKKRLDVDPKIGRVLIFQHKQLLHSGDDVLEGLKYTMRTDLMFRPEMPESV